MCAVHSGPRKALRCPAFKGTAHSTFRPHRRSASPSQPSSPGEGVSKSWRPWRGCGWGTAFWGAEEKHEAEWWLSGGTTGIVLCALACFSLVLQLPAQVMCANGGPQDAPDTVVGYGRSGRNKPKTLAQIRVALTAAGLNGQLAYAAVSLLLSFQEALSGHQMDVPMSPSVRLGLKRRRRDWTVSPIYLPEND